MNIFFKPANTFDRRGCQMPLPSSNAIRQGGGAWPLTFCDILGGPRPPDPPAVFRGAPTPRPPLHRPPKYSCAKTFAGRPDLFYSTVYTQVQLLRPHRGPFRNLFKPTLWSFFSQDERVTEFCTQGAATEVPDALRRGIWLLGSGFFVGVISFAWGLDLELDPLGRGSGFGLILRASALGRRCSEL